MTKVSVNTSVKDFTAVQRALEELTKELNTIKEKLDASSSDESERSGTEGAIRIIKDTPDNSLFEIKAKDGWKKPFIGESQVFLKAETSNVKFQEKKSIDEIEAEDAVTESSKAIKIIFDEKADKFILPRPDYDSGWTLDGTSALTHSLGTEAIKLIQVSYNNAQDDTTSTIYNTNDAGGSSPTAVVVTNGINAITATISNGLNYYRVRLWK